MCRFLIIKSKNKLDSETHLKEFADVCEKSIAPNGDRQEDGWGAAWFDEEMGWHRLTSLAPIWKDKEKFASVPQAKLLVVHARSATHPKEKGNISFNQPFIDGDYCFVFNGALKGVTIKRKIPGEIGSQKIWSLLKEYLTTDPPPKALRKLKIYLEKNCKEIIALNLGIVTQNSAAVLNTYGKDKNYYTIHYSKGEPIIVCSENYLTTKEMANDQIKII